MGKRPEVILVTGGARSGKSRFALSVADRFDKRVFVATAVPFDDEMRERIRAHQEERGDAFTTVEESHDLVGALRGVPEGTQVAVVDCLTVWLGNLLHDRSGASGPEARIEKFLDYLDAPNCALVLVTNEVGMGIVPEARLARRFRDLAGSLHQQIAKRADRLVLMVCGVPVFAKGDPL